MDGTTQTAASGTLPNGEQLGASVGAPVAGVEDAMWANGYGFEGPTTCAGEVRALVGCKTGDSVLRFQPVALGKKGHVYLRVDNGHIAQIGWDLKTVAFSDG